MPAILFGSVSTIADTSELQRVAFNKAFEVHGLGWHWDRDEYLALLETSGGEKRIADYARSLGQDVDARAVHATKSELFQTSLADTPAPPRPGVVETIDSAKRNGFKVGLVTTTSPGNVAALVESLQPHIRRSDFDVIVDSSSVGTPKPNGAAYVFALDALGEPADACIAIEDNLDGLGAARAAGLRCVAFPNHNTAGHHFDGAERFVDRLDAEELRGLVVRAGETR